MLPSVAAPSFDGKGGFFRSYAAVVELACKRASLDACKLLSQMGATVRDVYMAINLLEPGGNQNLLFPSDCQGIKNCSSVKE